MRGKDAFQRKQLHEVGITPACAGKSLCNLYISVVPKDHPRVCGEKTPMRSEGVRGVGSPPRVRGKGRPGRLRVWLARITPACAGKSGCCNPDPQGQRDHPRVCGEKITPLLFLALASGSPPRVRGKEDTAGSLDAVRGITPACAGKSGAPVGRLAVVRDHPRVCGEKRVATSATGTGTGSPPRVRGKGSSMVQ